jgi:hypothetical protein
MQVRTTLIWLLSTCAGNPTLPALEPPAQFSSGAEWVLDGDGNVLASSAVVLEHTVDRLHGTLHVRVLRETPDPTGLLPAESSLHHTIVAHSARPWSLEGRVSDASTLRTDLAEKLQGGVLVSRSTTRDADGRVVTVRIINTTPLSHGEFTTWSSKLLARR